MRRSCHFCRSRKIKCSGQSKCDACRERSIDCVYGTEASKGRPRGSGTSKSSEAVGRGLQVDRTAVDMGHPEPDLMRRSTATGSMGSASPTMARQGSSGGIVGLGAAAVAASRARCGGGGTVAGELEYLFHLNFSLDASEGGTGAYQDAIASYHRRMCHSEHANDANSVAGSDKAVLGYDGSLALLTQELVEMLSVRYGGLGCHHLGSCRGQFFVRSLEADPAESMFDATVPEEDPLHGFDDYRTLQMIDVWFANHPLSTILSKTMLLREYRSNTHDDILLAVILADAMAMGSPCTQGPSEALYRFAASRFRARSLQNCSLSTAQSLVLLGWRGLCTSQARRATCYFGYASQIVTRLRVTAAQMPAVRMSRINGVDVGQVESEMIGNLYWVTFALTLWTFMQFDGSFAHLLPGHLSTDFPPVDEACSAVAQLDIVSDNVSTLQAQARSIRELWQLSHIASTIGHIYALFPREALLPVVAAAAAAAAEMTTTATAGSSLGWQARPLHQLRQLFTPNQDVGVLCVRIRQILAEASGLLETQVVAPTSQAYVLTAYHTVITYLLFPKSSFDRATERMTSDTVDGLSRAACAIVDIAARLDGTVAWSPLNSDPGPSAVANMLTLGLDACGRAMALVLAKLERGSADEHQLVFSRRGELASLAAALHKLAKSEKVCSARRLRPVKKQLKRVLLQLQLQQQQQQQHSGSTTPSVTMPDDHPASLVTPPRSMMTTPDFTDRSSIEMDLSSTPTPSHGAPSFPHHQPLFPILHVLTSSPSADDMAAAAAASAASHKTSGGGSRSHSRSHCGLNITSTPGTPGTTGTTGTTMETIPGTMTGTTGGLMSTMSSADMSAFGLNLFDDMLHLNSSPCGGGGSSGGFDGLDRLDGLDRFDGLDGLGGDPMSFDPSSLSALSAAGEPLDYGGQVDSLEQLQRELGLSQYS